MPRPTRRRASTRPSTPRRLTRSRASRSGRLSHLNARGEARMVDVGSKPVTLRRATAEGEVRMRPTTLALITKGGLKKGDVLAVARVAAIQAAKRTAELIPLCHPIPVSAIDAELIPERSPARVRCRVTVTTSGQTGVEMEALTAVSAGLLTVYDMCKAVDRGMILGRIRLLEKSGGQSGDWRRRD